ncbi:preprotein translocase subunit SecG [Methylovirgula sp. 4M-Z18]|uniref:preprotein translocase subunit SecG n=1 Tax=Methylovirgula sp. 4M-Z18 TaxID=2293567 RepID=UPI000E2F9EB5|nr:preprotein translocase subunit SecG [Methylovirgula sp. 4M-Z18]RFB80550.1 preprotein translocase subunit SecG [Methylovirgula sp. 4M-Z18]
MLQSVLIVIHLMVVVALVGVVLLQRSEGGALGQGGGGGFMTGRGQANALTRTTGILAAIFFITSLSLGILASRSRAPSSLFNNLPQTSAPASPGQQDDKSLFDKLNEQNKTPAPQTPAAPAAPEAPKSE